jgi:hypothetical protein
MELPRCSPTATKWFCAAQRLAGGKAKLSDAAWPVDARDGVITRFRIGMRALVLPSPARPQARRGTLHKR